MTAEKNLEANKQAEKLADERLSDDELDNVAGGTGAYQNKISREPSEHEVVTLVVSADVTAK